MNIGDCWYGSSFAQNVKDTINNLKNSEKNLEKINEQKNNKININQDIQKEDEFKSKNKINMFV